MNRLRSAIALASATALILVATGSVAASPTATFHGTFGGDVDFYGCTTTPPIVEADGMWSVKLRGSDAAVVAINIFTNGAHHVSFGGVVPQVDTVGSEEFAVAFETGAGTLRISLTGTALSYEFPDGYLYDSLDCANVVYHGTLTH